MLWAFWTQNSLFTFIATVGSFRLAFNQDLQHLLLRSVQVSGLLVFVLRGNVFDAQILEPLKKIMINWNPGSRHQVFLNEVNVLGGGGLKYWGGGVEIYCWPLMSHFHTGSWDDLRSPQESFVTAFLSSFTENLVSHFRVKVEAITEGIPQVLRPGPGEHTTIAMEREDMSFQGWKISLPWNPSALT